jgi:hypothetical protein
MVGIGGNGLRLSVAPNTIVQGNYVGTDITGTDSLGNESSGIAVRVSDGTLVGGTIPEAGNLVSANNGGGIFLQGDWESVAIVGNRVGVDARGGPTLGNAVAGIIIDGDGWTVGGSELGEGNVVGANFGPGVWVDGRDATILGNFVGVDEIGADIGNRGHGIFVDTQGRNTVIGGTESPGAGNNIANNGGSGIHVEQNLRDVAFWYQNSIYDNERLGIDLVDRNDGDDGVTPNDQDDRDGSGPNEYQNFPELAKNADGTVQVTLDSAPNMTYRVEYFGSPICDATGHGEGKVFLFAEEVTTDGEGVFSASRSISTLAGQESLTAVAIDPVNGASEFSMCSVAEVEPAFVVILHSDSLGIGFAPVVPNTDVDIFKVDLSNLGSPFSSMGSQATDADGRLLLDPASFGPGDGVMFRSKVAEELSPKPNRSVVDFYAYQTFIDNLIIDRNGSVNVVELPASTDTELHTYMGHVSVMFNLIVSVEWRITETYLDGLQGLLALTSNFLYDYTNGQAQLGKVAIVDDKQMWKDADVHIEAANTAWPYAMPFGIGKLEGTLDYPPRMYGLSIAQNIEGMFDEIDIDPFDEGNSRAIGHELGHYLLGLLDEYEDENGTRLKEGVQFSVMDEFSRKPRGSEISARESMTELEWEQYKRTQQYVEREGLDGWTVFSGLFSAPDHPTLPTIVSRPSRQGVIYPDLVTGPNDVFDEPDLFVGALIDFVVDVTNQPVPRPTFLLTDKFGRPRGDIQVGLEWETGTQKFWMNQGKTLQSGPNKGMIRPLGASPGRRLVAIGSSKEGFSFAEVEVPAGKLTDNIVVEMQDVAGSQKMLASVSFNEGGGLTLDVATTESLGDQPSISFIGVDGSVDFALDGGPADYSVDLPLDTEPSNLLLRATDSDGTAYPVPHTLSILGVGDGTGELRAPGAGLELVLDSEDNGAGSLAVLSSPFPAPETGIPDSMVIASPVIGIGWGIETDAIFTPRLKIYYDADSLFSLTNTGVTIFKWDDGAASWTALPTVTSGDTTNQTASTEISDGGLYVAYLDLAQATATSTEDDVAEIPANTEIEGMLTSYPNPVTGTTRIPLALDESALVGITVYNILGQEVEHIEPRLVSAGEIEIELDATTLPAGTYVYVAKIGGESRRGILKVVR